MTRSLLPPTLFIVLFGSSCIESWKGVDGDGDGWSAADGDCWDVPGSPPGSSLSGDQIYPGAKDTPYDGIDADCGGNDDYDLDGDGYVVLDEHVGLTTLGVESSGNHIAGGDCWNDPDRPHDFDAFEHGMIFTNVTGDQLGPADVHPDQADTWYDGPDQDCGLNNDFDQDGDGHRTSQIADQYGEAGDDCYDLHPADDPDINFGNLDASEIYTGATEIWYDGTDQDCSGVYNDGLETDQVLSDCDKDGDGAPVDNTSAVPPESVCTEYTGILRDCNDELGDVYPDPSVEEIPYNGVDDNCSPVDESGAPDADGDADGDGYWDVDYLDRIAALGDPDLPDETVDLTDAEFTDCWDDPDVRPEGYTGQPVYAFDPQADPESADAFTVAFEPDHLQAFDVNPAAYDMPYDLVDQDCAGDGTPEVELDWDGDGYDSQVQWHDDGAGGLQSGDDCMDCSADCAEPEPGSDLEALCQVLCDNDAYDFGAAGSGALNPGGFESDEVNPGATDTWYDGTDQDCQADIDYDFDGDFYATDPDSAVRQGEAREAYYSWSTVGSLYGATEDCNDTDRFINPDGIDDWYDGVDQDCAGNDDYDQDYDGYVPDAYAGLVTYQSELDASNATDYRLSATGSLPADDCVDVPNSDSDLDGALYHPGATDACYDGFDKDCADNDDWDCDGDGYASELEEATSSDYAATYHAGAMVAGTGTFSTDDCDDTDSAIYPDATETWYNGVDDDCDEADDWDQDRDGHADEDYASAYTTTVNEAGAISGTGLLDTDDCNDTESAINPDETDTWYDGVDHDCAGNDDWDFDEDGHAATSDAASAQGARYATYGTTYQSESSTAAYALSSTGSLSVDDCNDEEAVIYTGASDSWYDGVDHDCDERDDYDADEDGYLDDSYVGLDTYQSAVSDTAYRLASTGSLPGNDCVEEDASYNPDATDTWYDGLDHDCADNDDWDEDEDGHAATSAAATASGASSYVTYTVTKQGTASVSGTGSLSVDDCNDEEDDIYDGAADSWYDGIDHDCAGNDDWDRDEDASAATSTAASLGGSASYTTYRTTYQSSSTSSAYAVSGTGSLTADDCNDEDATIFVGATDTWQDGIDQDCGGNDDYDIDADDYVEDAYVGLATYQSASLESTYVVSGTGGLAGDDCVEGNAAYNPGETDAWYDGNDVDCADNDDWDADGDGRAATAAAAASESAAYTTYTTTKHAGTAVSGTGSLSVNDCNDTDEDFHGDASDTLYDGFDHDCAGNDDWDGDVDGYAATSDAASASGASSYSTYGVTYQSNPASSSYVVSGTGSAAVTDCNDEEDSINPGEVDVWLDGADSDCGGEDDYDIDSDGYVADLYDKEKTYQSDVDDAAYFVAGTGSLPKGDCVPTVAAYNPGATEVWYDSFDYDCGEDDDWDADGDGFAATSAAATAAGAASYVSYTTTTQAGSAVSGTGGLAVDDCNDEEDDVNTGQTDTWYDGTDADCGGNDDFDQDGDTYVADTYSSSGTYQSFDDKVTSTYQLSVSRSGAGDCLDADVGFFTAADYNPGETDNWYDGQDKNCDSANDYDADADGYVENAYTGTDTKVAGTVVFSAPPTNGGDCNDDESAFSPAESDSWYDGWDHDCGGDDDYDADGDLYVPLAYSGLATYTDTAKSTAVSGTGSLPTDDCDDTPGAGAVINPDATEVCDAADEDENCNGSADDADSTVDPTTQTTYYTDADGDTYGADGSGALYCDAPSGLVLIDGDCDDDATTGGAINPGAAEICDPADVDENCNDLADDADSTVTGTFTNFYPDADGDGFGDDSVSATQQCDAPSGYVTDNTDCDDTVGTGAAINTDATEVCDESDVDEDCNNLADDADSGVDTSTYTDWFPDADGDGFGADDVAATSQCNAPSGYVADDTDCDDDPATGAAINTDGDEGTVYADADGIDNDCDTYIDEGVITANSEYLLITELMINPDAVVDTDGEWFEVHNPNAFDVTITSDWSFADDSGAFIPTTDLLVPSLGYAVFAKVGPTSTNGNVNADYVYGSDIGALLNATGSDSITIYYENPEAPGVDITVDRVVWNYGSGPGGGWTTTAGASLQLDNQPDSGTGDPVYPREGDSKDNADKSSWCDATVQWDTGTDFGSPGEDNESCP